MSSVCSYPATSGSASRLTSATPRSAWMPVLSASDPIRSRGPGGAPSSPPASGRTGGLTEASRPRSLAHSPRKRTTSPGSVDPATTWSRRPNAVTSAPAKACLPGASGRARSLRSRSSASSATVVGAGPSQSGSWSVNSRSTSPIFTVRSTPRWGSSRPNGLETVPEGVGAALADGLDPDQPGGRVDHGGRVAAVSGVHGQPGEALPGVALGVVDAQVEGVVGVGHVVVDGDAQSVAPDAGFLGVDLQDAGLAVPVGGFQGGAGGLAAAGLGDPDDHGDAAAVAEELVHRVGDGALRAEPAESGVRTR
ncbi:hypothetical protein SGLAM104S_08216 [Streptomyces glaucescens]